MTSERIVFVDSETLGLGLNDPIWEFAAIVRDPGMADVPVHFFVKHDVTQVQNLPEKFRQDHDNRYDDQWALWPSDLVELVLDLFADRAHVVGACPWFDMTRIEMILNLHGAVAPWHHHLIDVEALMVGRLAALRYPIPMPWRSDDLAPYLGVAPTGARHTAMGDAEWVRDIYDAVMQTGPTPQDQMSDALRRGYL